MISPLNSHDFDLEISQKKDYPLEGQIFLDAMWKKRKRRKRKRNGMVSGGGFG